MKNKKNITLFLFSQSLTLLGSSIVQFAIIWYITIKTSSGVWVSILTMASYVPQFIISFFSGVWADRLSKKFLIILSDLSIAIATLALIIFMLITTNEIAIFMGLVIISIIRSLGTGIQTPAINATIPYLVPEENLMKFNGINSTIQSLIQFASPAIAGLILTNFSLRETLIIDIVTAIIGIVIFTFVSIPYIKKEKIEFSMLKEMKEGFNYAIQQKFIGKILIVFGIFIFLCVPAGFLASLFVERYYGDTYWYLTLVEVIGFIGMTIGGLIIGTWGGFKNRMKTLVIGMISFGILAIGMGVISNFVIYLILMAVYGIALTMVQTASTTILQEKVNENMQGRIFGLFGAMYSGFLPLGMVVFGPLADVVSMRLLMVISGILLLLMAFIIFIDKKFYKNG